VSASLSVGTTLDVCIPKASLAPDQTHDLRQKSIWWLGVGGAILARVDVEVAALTGNALADLPRHLDEEKISRYAQVLDQLPPVVVFELDDGLLLVDGYHRVEAARRLGRTVVRAEVRQGSRQDALRFTVDLAAAERGVTKAQALDAIRRRSGRRWGGK
jgi:ParB/Sulfiredoxin domain